MNKLLLSLAAAAALSVSGVSLADCGSHADEGMDIGAAPVDASKVPTKVARDAVNVTPVVLGCENDRCEPGQQVAKKAKTGVKKNKVKKADATG